MAKTDADGRFQIENLPAGQRVFRLWHERTGYLRKVPIGSLSTDAKGHLTITIRKGNNELTDASLSAKMFEVAD